MKRPPLFASLVATVLLGLLPAGASADDKLYRVTLTNITAGQSFTPALVFSHNKRAMPFFTAGQAAGPELEQLAEGGNTMPVLDKMMTQGHVTDHATAFGVDGLIAPGESVSVELMAGERGGIGIGAMLLPTNDGFIGAHGIRLPKGHRSTSQTLAAMDAGTEVNDESCAHIPGPVCGGEPVSMADGEGFVHVHGGIHGIGDLMASGYDWRNPVAKITVERVRD
jgi:hypothetical protein